MANDNELGKGQTCFIVSPIGNKLDPMGTDGRVIYEDNIQMWAEVLEPACEIFGLKAVRADRIAETGEITEQIFQYLRDADVVIADLSGANPNVMYELGLRHTRDKLTIQIGEYGRLPFDVNTIRTIQFRRTEAGRIEARNSLTEALRSGLQGNGSPVAATRVWNEGASIAAESVALAVERSHETEEMDAGDDEPGIMDMLAEGEAALGEVSGTLDEMTGISGQIGQLMNESIARIKESDAKKKGFAGRLIVARQLAHSLAEPTGLFEGLANDYVGSVAKLDAMVDYILRRMEEDPAEAEDGQGFLRAVIKLADAVDGVAVSVAHFREGAVGLRKLAKDLAPASKTIERSLNRYASGNTTISGWRGRIEPLLDEEPETGEPEA